jgi:hypothetical protein
VDECIHLISPARSCGVCHPTRKWNWAALAARDGGVPSEGVPLVAPLFTGDDDDAAPQGEPLIITAEHHSGCPACGEHIKPGDKIAHDDELDAWVCGGCAPR